MPVLFAFFILGAHSGTKQWAETLTYIGIDQVIVFNMDVITVCYHISLKLLPYQSTEDPPHSWFPYNGKCFYFHEVLFIITNTNNK